MGERHDGNGVKQDEKRKRQGIHYWNWLQYKVFLHSSVCLVTLLWVRSAGSSALVATAYRSFDLEV